jgi:hypothetical protein
MSAKATRIAPAILPESEDEDAELHPTTVLDHAQVAALAYQFWLERGCPVGSPDVDWFRAEGEVKALTEG